MFMKNYFILC